MDAKFKPHKDFFRYIKREYARINYGASENRVEDYVLQRLLSAAYGCTAWLLTKQGAEWVFASLGVEEVAVHPGFKYYFHNGGTRKRIDDNMMKIWRRCPTAEVIVDRDGIEIAKRVVYTEGWKVPDDKLFVFTMRSYEKWLKMLPAQDFLRDNFSPLKYLAIFSGVAYRCGSQDGEVYWLSTEQVQSEAKESGNCCGCDIDFPCIDNYSGLGSLCNKCYTENFGDSETLTLCTRHECKEHGCCNHITQSRAAEDKLELDKLPIKWSNYG